MVPQKHDVDVGAQSDVERQVPADVVRIVVNHNLVTVPHPTVAEANVIGGDTEVEPPKPEATGPSAGQMPNVAAANSARKVAMLPGVIEVVVGITRAGVVTNPFAIGVNVRRIGVPGRVAKMTFFRSRRRMRLNMRLGRAMGGDMSCRCAPVFFTFALTMLRPSRNGNNQQYHKNSTEPFHASLLKAFHCKAPQAL